MSMVLAILTYFVFTLLTLKVALNFCQPYVVYWEMAKSGSETSPAFTILPILLIDAILVGLSVLFLSVTEEQYLICSRLWLIIIAIILPFLSYAHVILAGFICSWIFADMRRRNARPK